MVLASLRNFLTSSVVAKVIKSKKERRVVAGACTSFCGMSVGWFVTVSVAIGTDAVSP